MSLSSAAHAAIHAPQYLASASFPLLLRSRGDFSQKQSLKSSLKVISRAKLLPVCMLSHESTRRFIPLLRCGTRPLLQPKP